MIDSIDTITSSMNSIMEESKSVSKDLQDLIDSYEAALKANSQHNTVQSIENAFIKKYIDEYSKASMTPPNT